MLSTIAYIPCELVCECEWKYGLHTCKWNLEISTYIDEYSIEKLRKNECEKLSTNWQFHEMCRGDCRQKCFLKNQLKNQIIYHWLLGGRFLSMSDCISSSLVFLAPNVYFTMRCICVLNKAHNMNYLCIYLAKCLDIRLNPQLCAWYLSELWIMCFIKTFIQSFKQFLTLKVTSTTMISRSHSW